MTTSRSIFNRARSGVVTALERSQIDRARRSVLGFNAYLTVFTPRMCFNGCSSTGRCMSACVRLWRRGFLRGLLTRPLLEPQFIMERDFRAAYRNLDQVMESNVDRCRLKHLKEMWAAKRSRLVWLGLVGDNSWDWINLHVSRHIPCFARHGEWISLRCFSPMAGQLQESVRVNGNGYSSGLGMICDPRQSLVACRWGDLHSGDRGGGLGGSEGRRSRCGLR